MESSQATHKRLKIAYHETGHAVIELFCGQVIQKVSLKEINSPIGEDKYLGHMKLVPTDPKEILTVNKAIQNVMISLGGFASEILFFNDVPGIPVDDLDRAIKYTESLLKTDGFKEIVVKMPIPEPDILPKATDPLVRAFIDFKVNHCVEVLSQVKPIIQIIAQELFKKEELTGDEVTSIFNTFSPLNPIGASESSIASPSANLKPWIPE